MDIRDHDEVDLEFGFLIGLVGFSSWILIQGLSYSETTRLYPVVTSVSVIILSLLILVNKFLPIDVRRTLPFTSGRETEGSLEAIDDVELEGGEVNEANVVYLALYFGVYLISVIYIGFIISSMGLMYIVQRHFGYKDWKFRLVMTVLMGLAVVVGSLVVRIPLTHGEVFDWIF